MWCDGSVREPIKTTHGGIRWGWCDQTCPEFRPVPMDRTPAIASRPFAGRPVTLKLAVRVVVVSSGIRPILNHMVCLISRLMLSRRIARTGSLDGGRCSLTNSTTQ